MKIYIEPHTVERAEERGTTEKEIIDVIENGINIPAKYNRFGKYKIFDFDNERNGKFYEHKKVEVYYIIENDKIITVTVYLFYGKWKD
jgi:hypothetical protein